MKALVKAERAEGLVLRDEPKPEIGPDDILIQVAKTGICGTDLHIESWDPWAARTIRPPQIIGHEFVGEIVEDPVRALAIGDEGEVDGIELLGHRRSPLARPARWRRRSRRARRP